MAASAASQLGWVWRGSCRIIRSPLPTTEDCEFLPWLNSIVRAFTLYCLTLRREILFPLGWFGSSAMQMTRRSPYRQSERSGVA